MCRMKHSALLFIQLIVPISFFKFNDECLQIFSTFTALLKMSIDEVERTIPLGPRQLFAHSAFIQPEVERFRDAFERNERFKEFEGLIRAKNRMYEALEANLTPSGTSNKLTSLAAQMHALAERIGDLMSPHFSQEELSRLDLTNMLELAKAAEIRQKQFTDRRKGEESSSTATTLPIQILQTVDEEEMEKK